METKLSLSHDEMVVLAAIADQELVLQELIGELRRLGFYKSAQSLLPCIREMEEAGLVKSWLGISPFPLYFPCAYYKIEPDILALNNPPYSYESWRNLSE